MARKKKEAPTLKWETRTTERHEREVSIRYGGMRVLSMTRRADSDLIKVRELGAFSGVVPLSPVPEGVPVDRLLDAIFEIQRDIRS